MTVHAPAVDETFAIPADEARLDRAAEALRGNGFVVHVVDTVTDARGLVLSLVPDGESVFTASSETLRLTGITEAVDDSGRLHCVRTTAGDLGEDVNARIRLAATPDVVVGSVHAVSEDGVLLVGSATGSQLAPYASGARKRSGWSEPRRSSLTWRPGCAASGTAVCPRSGADCRRTTARSRSSARS
ncbi:LUD domain-containing protein [Streptomyces scabichelini]|uniref:LUD domain-containing protein n=1 Tax=Streptomyces scabichelini TaxID=2711217 RepID=UPI001F493E3C|nr:LUD domain-containing protein [Streptomyces scabichelini]